MQLSLHRFNFIWSFPELDSTKRNEAPRICSVLSGMKIIAMCQVPWPSLVFVIISI